MSGGFGNVKSLVSAQYINAYDIHFTTPLESMARLRRLPTLRRTVFWSESRQKICATRDVSVAVTEHRLWGGRDHAAQGDADN
jgi:hypothetical protein